MSTNTQTIQPLYPETNTQAASQEHPSLVRLLHLMSPSLPTGGFAYSQGLEWAVETGWVTDDETLKQWLSQLLLCSLAKTDIPVIKRLYEGCRANDLSTGEYWVHMLLAMRETRELYQEEQTRGRALAAILKEFSPKNFEKWTGLIKSSQAAGYAFAASTWDIPIKELLQAYAWAWLENQVMAGIKLIPLGQVKGHRVLYSMDDIIKAAVNTGLNLQTKDIGASMPAMAIGSSLHENQYTRLFRS